MSLVHAPFAGGEPPFAGASNEQHGMATVHSLLVVQD
jgi:hypothetical protein